MAAQSPAPGTAERIAAALWFAGRGFGIFPVWSTRDGRCRCPAGASCTSPGKHPITANGFKDATTDESRIRTFLSAGSEPNYGMLPPDGVFVWDVDTDDERARLAALEARHGPLPATLRDDTGNGQHLFLRWPEGLPRPIHKMFGLVTRWGSGAAQGYVVGPLSVHVSGRVYRSAAGTTGDIATLPDAWAAAAVAGETGTITFKPAGGDASAVQVGGRHDWLRDRARFYAGTLRDPDVLLAAVMAENDKLAVPKARDEVIRAIGDALLKFPADPVEEDPETGERRTFAPDDIGMLAPDESGDFPPPPAPAAYGGVLGECAIALAGGTDASLVGLLGSLLAFSGALIPGQAYQHRMQTTSPYIALVGESGTGRKGTAMWRAHGAMCDALEEVYVNRVLLDGINSGEGLITALEWRQRTYPQEPTVGLLFEEEFATVLASRSRDGSTLDPKLRAAWDGGPLSNRRSNETITVKPTYWLPALVAITPVELRARIGADAMQSGSANRWLYIPVARRADTGIATEPRLPGELRDALRFARRDAMDAKRPVAGVHPRVTATLTEYQDHVTRTSQGTAADLVRRMSGTAFRLALVHAMADRSGQVGPEHLERALAVTEYARRGLGWVFGGSVGNRDADLLLRTLRKVGRLRLRTITRELFRDPLRRQAAMDELHRLGYARIEVVQETGGRPREELVHTLQTGAFVHFGHVSNISDTPDAPDAGQNGQKSTDGLDRSRTEAGQNVDRSVTEPPVHEAVDATTGEVASTTTGDWLRPCRDYARHQDSHRNTAGGWVCLACDQEETTA